jgi:hypothetical protein
MATIQRMKRYCRSAGIVALLLGAAAAGCSGEKPASSENDPNTPAVVGAPPVVLTSDTLRPDTTADTQIKIASVKLDLTAEYAILGLATIKGDRAMISQYYLPDGVLRIGVNEFAGTQKVVEGWLLLARRGALTEIERRPGKIVWVGDVYTDSGTYTLRSNGENGKVREEKGRFVAMWQFAGMPAHWTMKSDHLMTPTSKP